MARSRIAYAVDEGLLLTIDRDRLLAFDAKTGASRWKLGFERSLFGVLFAPHRAVLRGQSGNPWRIAATGAEAIAVDRDGNVHAVDPAVGRVVAVAPLPAGKQTPVAIAASPDALAIALMDSVLLWREGGATTLPYRATALAFSRDGMTLAIGNAKGEVRCVEVATLEAPPPVRVRGYVTALAARRPGEWVAGTDVAIHRVDGTGARRISDDEAHEVACDAAGNLLAVRRSDLSVLVYEWWPASPMTLITSRGPRLDGIAFGAPDRLAIALDHGDASVVDLSTPSKIALQTSPAAGSSICIEPDVTSPAKPLGLASHFGLGALMSLALLFVCVGYVSSTHQSWVPTPAFLDTDDCNAVCERDRLSTLRAACDTHGCGAAAEDGLALTCDLHMVAAPRAVPEIVRLVGPDLVEETESTPLVGDDPRALYVAPDGSVFLATIVRSGRCAIRRKMADGWRASTESLDCRSVALYGRDANDVFAGLGSVVRHFDGTRWIDLGFPGEEVRAIAGDPKRPGVVFVLDSTGAIRSEHGGTWTEELIRTRLQPRSLFAGASRMWAQAGPGDTLLERDDVRPEWAPTARAQHGAVWAASDGTSFSAYGTTITTMRDGDSTDHMVPAFVALIWGRSRADVYAAGPAGLIHYDGVTWSKTSFSRRVRALAGNATDLYVVADR